MKVHLRFDSSDGIHARTTLFINGGNCGVLTMSNEEARWLHHILWRGCESLSPRGKTPIEFVSSGKEPEVDELAEAAMLRNLG